MRTFQITIFITLISVSAMFTLNLALGLGVTVAEKGLMVTGLLALEALKAFVLISAKTSVGQRRWVKGACYSLAYIFFGIISLFSCLGFTLSTVDRMGTMTRALDHEAAISMELATASDCGEQIKTLRSQSDQRQAVLARMDPHTQAGQMAQLRKANSECLAQVNGYLDRRREALDRADNFRAKDREARATNRRSLYDVIGENLHLSGSHVAFIVLALFSLAVELGVFITSPHAGKGLKESQGEQVRSRRDGHSPNLIRWALGLLVPTTTPDLPTQARIRDRRPCRSPTAESSMG